MHDQEKAETLNSQMQELDLKIQNVDREINQTELVLKDLRRLQGQIATKTGERKSKHEEAERRYQALTEENEGMPSYTMSLSTHFPCLHVSYPQHQSCCISSHYIFFLRH